MAATTIAKYRPGHDAEDTLEFRKFKPPTSLKEYKKAGVEASIRSYEVMGLGTGNEGTRIPPNVLVMAYLTISGLFGYEKTYMGPPKGKRRGVMDYHQ